MKSMKYWPWGDDSEGEIYDNPSWDLPGYRRSTMASAKILRKIGSHHGVSSKTNAKKRTLA